MTRTSSNLCFNCFNSSHALLPCSCGRAFYCGEQCRQTDWERGHGALCQEGGGWQVDVALKRCEEKGRYVQVQQDVKQGQLLLVDYALISKPDNILAVQCLITLDLQDCENLTSEYSQIESSTFLYPPLALLLLVPSLEAHSGLPRSLLALIALVWHRAAVQSRRSSEESMIDVWKILDLSAPTESPAPTNSLSSQSRCSTSSFSLQPSGPSDRRDCSRSHGRDRRQAMPIADLTSLSCPTNFQQNSETKSSSVRSKSSSDCTKATMMECFVVVLSCMTKCPELAHFLRSCSTCSASSWGRALHMQASRLFKADVMADVALKWINNAMAWGSVVDEDSAEGASVFGLGAMLEHSCEPNTHWDVREDWTRLKLVACEDILRGTALSISYIPQGDVPASLTLNGQASLSSSLVVRQSHFLEQWGFCCSCPRCTREASASLSSLSPMAITKAARRRRRRRRLGAYR